MAGAVGSTMTHITHSSFFAIIFSSFVSTGSTVEVLDGSPRFTVHGYGRGHFGELAKHNEPRHGAPAVGHDLARRDAEVGEDLAEEAVKWEAHPGLQRMLVHADAPWGRRRARALVARG